MKYGTRASLEAIPRKTIEITVAETGETFVLREMSGTDRDKFEVSAFKDETETKIVDGKETSVSARKVDPLYLRARLVALCLVEKDSNVRLYADDEIHMLSDKLSASVIGQFFAAAQKMNALDGAAVEDAAKNSESAPAGASSSDSH